MKIKLTKVSCMVLAAIPFVSMAAPNPVSWDKMVQYVTLSASDWAAVCSSGLPSSADGCYGNVNSKAFEKVNRLTGGFLTYSNVNSVNAPDGSVYIKAFYAGTNTPVTAGDVSVTIASGVARCGIYLQQGTGLDTLYGGSIYTGTNNNYTAGPVTAHPVTITGIGAIGVYTGPGVFAPQQPLYLLCAGVSGSDGSTAASIQDQIKAG